VDVKVVALPEPAGSQPSKNEEEEEPVIEKREVPIGDPPFTDEDADDDIPWGDLPLDPEEDRMPGDYE